MLENSTTGESDNAFLKGLLIATTRELQDFIRSVLGTLPSIPLLLVLANTAHRHLAPSAGLPAGAVLSSPSWSTATPRTASSPAPLPAPPSTTAASPAAGWTVLET